MGEGKAALSVAGMLSVLGAEGPALLPSYYFPSYERELPHSYLPIIPGVGRGARHCGGLWRVQESG